MIVKLESQRHTGSVHGDSSFSLFLSQQLSKTGLAMVFQAVVHVLARCAITLALSAASFFAEDGKPCSNVCDGVSTGLRGVAQTVFGSKERANHVS